MIANNTMKQANMSRKLICIRENFCKGTHLEATDNRGFYAGGLPGNPQLPVNNLLIDCRLPDTAAGYRCRLPIAGLLTTGFLLPSTVY